MMNRFKTKGEMFQQPIAGYRRKKSEELCDVERLDEWTPTILQGAQMVLGMATDIAVAEFFDSVGFKPGPFSDSLTWSGVAVHRLYSNTILEGRPQRGARTSEKKYEAGKRRPVKNPEGPTYIDRPDLAHLDHSTFELLQAHFTTKAERYRRARAGEDCLTCVARSKSRFPGHTAGCYYCGHAAVWGGNGQKNKMMCSGSRQHKCWCSFGVDGRRITQATVSMVIEHLAGLPAFEGQFKQMLESAADKSHRKNAESPEHLQRELTTLKQFQANTTEAIAATGGIESLYEKLRQLEADEKLLNARLEQARTVLKQPLDLPKNLQEMISEIRRCLSDDIDSYLSPNPTACDSQ